MKMRNFILIILTFLAIIPGKTQSIKISLLNDQLVNSLTIDIKQGTYFIRSGSETLGEYRKGSIFYITRFNDQIELRDKRNFVGNFTSLKFECPNGDGIINVKPVNPMIDSREYDDNLTLKCSNSRIWIINELDMEKYIAAVIEAEGGNNAPFEYYKAQAVLIRTFTIKNMFKHVEEGFNLCDQVHCQAYKARSSQHPEILKATLSTAGLVLIGKDSILIMSPFHSNCGGETSESGMVWQQSLPYLKPVIDPFCDQTNNARWSVVVPRNQWLKYISEANPGKVFYTEGNFSYKLTHRSKIVIVNNIELNLRNVRETFGLKSTFFSIADKGSEIEFYGKGFGHGVGMCQQGAMEMAHVGYTWLDIIHFYYQQVNLVDYREMKLERY
jgi:stage II sporulation protein D